MTVNERIAVFAELVPGSFTDVSEDLDPDLAPVALSWGRRDEFADPEPTQMNFTLVTPTGKYLPQATYPGWSKGSGVRLVNPDTARVYWTGVVVSFDPSWGGGESASWVRVTISAVNPAAAIEAKMPSLFDVFQGVSVPWAGATFAGTTGRLGDYWPLAGDTENILNPDNPCVLGPQIAAAPGAYAGSLEYGPGGPVGDRDGASAGLNDADDMTGGWYLASKKPVARPEWVTAWVVHKPKLVRSDPTTVQYNPGLFSVHTSSFTSMLSLVDPGMLRLIIRADRNVGSGASWGQAAQDTTIKLDAGVPYLLAWAPRMMAVVAVNAITGQFQWWQATSSTPGWLSINYPPVSAAHYLTIGSINQSGSSQEDPTRYAFGGRIARVGLTTAALTVGTMIDALRGLKIRANREGLPFSAMTAIAGLTTTIRVPPGQAASSIIGHASPSQTDELVWSDTAGKTRRELARELAINTEGGGLAVFSDTQLIARGAMRRISPNLTVDAITDLDGPPSFVLDFTTQASTVTMKTASSEFVFKGTGVAEASQVTINTALLDANQIRMLAEDRLSKIRSGSLTLTSLTLDMTTSPMPWNPSLVLAESLVGPAGRVRITNLPPEIFTAGLLPEGTVDAFVIGGSFQAIASKMTLTLNLIPADAPPPLIVEDPIYGFLDTGTAVF